MVNGSNPCADVANRIIADATIEFWCIILMRIRLAPLFLDSIVLPRSAFGAANRDCGKFAAILPTVIGFVLGRAGKSLIRSGCSGVNRWH